jgi:putative transposase
MQRGNNGQAICKDAADYQTLIDLLGRHAHDWKVALHAYVLMESHFHVLATPQDALGFPKMMQAVGRQYVRYFNDKHHRTGTLWEGRYRSTLIQAELHLLACMVYMDLSPVRADMVQQATEYRWSSHGHYLGRYADRFVTPHILYWQLGNTPFAREAAYTELVQQGISSVQERALMESVMHGWALGDAGFVAALQKTTTRRLVKGLPGRPLAQSKTSQKT